MPPQMGLPESAFDLSTKPSAAVCHSLSLFCYALNEEDLIADFLHKSIRDLKAVSDDFEIIFHDDGSTDRTLERAHAVARKHPQIVVHSNGVNRGVGYCYQQSFKTARKTWVFVNTVDSFWDTARLGDFSRYFDNYDLVVGIRTERKHCYTLWRQIISWVNYYLIRFLFRIPLRDVQNVHFYKRSFIQNITVESRSSFASPEILIKARALGLRMKEVPMTYQPRKGGKAKGAKIKSLLHSLTDIILFWLKWIVGNYKSRFVSEFSGKNR